MVAEDFSTVNEGVKHFIARIPVSRIRSLVKHVKNELQVLAVLLSQRRDDERAPSACRPGAPQDPIFNALSLETAGAGQFSTEQYTVPTGKALTILLESMTLLAQNSKLISHFVRFFRVARSTSGRTIPPSDSEREPVQREQREEVCPSPEVEICFGSDSTETGGERGDDEALPDPPELLAEEDERLVRVFALSAASLVLAQVAQHRQRVDPIALAEYLTHNTRNVCLASSYAVLLCMSSMRVQDKASSPPSEDVPSLTPLPRASLPKMTLDPEPELSSDQDPPGHCAFELGLELPIKSAGTRCV